MQSGGAEADVTGLVSERFQIRCPQISHPALDAAGELLDCLVDRTGNFLECFDPFGGGLAGGVLIGVSVSSGAAGFHGGETAHAAILFVAFSADLNNVPGRFLTAGQQAAADDAVGEGKRFDDVAALGDAAIGEGGDTY